MNKSSYNINSFNTIDKTDLNRSIILFCDAKSTTKSYFDKLIIDQLRITHVTNKYSFEKALEEGLGKVIISDLSIVKGQYIHHTLMQKKIIEEKNHLSLVFVSSKKDINTRLAAIRSGARFLIESPIETNALLNTIDRCFESIENEPHRVLIISDNSAFNVALENAFIKVGVISQTISSATNVIETLDLFAPDLILLQEIFPKYTGNEIETIIRQNDHFSGIPLFFIKNSEKKEDIPNIFGNNFKLSTNKIIDIPRSVISITKQINQYRSLRDHASRDGLTGLLNQTITKKILNIEVSKAKRTKQLLTFVMIDIDNFKDVNDTHGHLIGDQVIKALSKLLKDRLRKSDIVGRLGGEEFGVILSGTSTDVALNIFTKIKVGFANLKYKTNQGKFSCSFSAGISHFPACQNSTQMLKIADKALYHAKNSGRNCIIDMEMLPT